MFPIAHLKYMCILAYLSSDLIHVRLTFLYVHDLWLEYVNSIALALNLNYSSAFAKQKILSALNDFLKSFLISDGVQYVESHMYQSVSY